MGLIGAPAQVKSLAVRKADSNFIYFHGNDLTRDGGLDGQYGSSIERPIGDWSPRGSTVKDDLFYGNETGGVLSLGSG